MHKRGKVLMGRRPANLTVVGLVLACLGGAISPAHAAVAGSGMGMTLDTRNSRFITGSGNYVIRPSVNSSMVTVDFECHATAGPDASQTRVHPDWENGCVLYKGSQAYKAPGQSLPGHAAITKGTAMVSLAVPGEFQICWYVSATYLLNGGFELPNRGCNDFDI